MRTTLRILTPLFAAAGAAAAIVVAPAAGAQPAPEPAPAPAPTQEQRPQASSLLPQCVNEGGSAALGGSATECATPGNVQINDTPAQQEYVGPWGDMWGEPGLFFP